MSQTPVDERFWSKVRRIPKPDGCWEWTGTINRQGYGTFSYRGQKVAAHRMSWFLARGDMPYMFILHKCDNRKCVRPSHLAHGTARANVRDMFRKGRGYRVVGPDNRGSRHGQAKLTEDEVRSIRQAKAEGMGLKELSARYRVGKPLLSMIINRQRWKHV